MAWQRQKEFSLMERVCGPSERRRVGWDRGRRNPAAATNAACLAQGTRTWQTSAKLSCGAGESSRGWPLPSLTLRVTTPVHFQARGHWEQQLWRSISGLPGITYSLCSWSSSRLPSSATAYGFIKYPQGSQSPEAGAGCGKVIQITNTVSEGPAGLWEDRTGILVLSASLHQGDSGSSRALDGIHCWGHRR